MSKMRTLSSHDATPFPDGQTAFDAGHCYYTVTTISKFGGIVQAEAQ